ncbi:Hypothetical predicted protein [Mytilus galloprovincialis]|uniref:Reverse transcriptase domain-containing protein n=1 Tax=Mytilus galloprovincialis TaxID=29158 RepID=A0A8B6EMS9_MYTGA|nr:Hypothetical predicted protein [Mytilus galloprovincialis]
MQAIMTAQRSDSKMFHKLVNAQRKSGKTILSELNVQGEIHTSKDDILQGWNKHFKQLATPQTSNENVEYTDREFDIDVIEEICKNNASPIIFTEEEICQAIGKLNTQKSSRYLRHHALLDAKSAFDVVNHNSLYRKLFLSGVGGTLWLLIRQLSTNALTSIKWDGLTSEPFLIQQGVRQGGILSTELYKLYVNDVLDQLEDNGLGKYIGDIYCGAPTCADDIALVANSPTELQVMISTVENYSKHEKYVLQPTKSVRLKKQRQ